uniref:TIL domain-containing protein n=1 Tax=Strongyloides venezuelensis TaxID=75913 RepID=A0A0K0F6Y1_STRVS
MKLKVLTFIAIFSTLSEIISSRKSYCPRNYTFVSNRKYQCSQKSGSLSKPKCFITLKSKCVCTGKYALDKKRRCVLKKDYPKKTTTTTRKPKVPKCNENMVYSKCPKQCSKECFQKNSNKCKKSKHCQKPRCICLFGYVLHGNRCISHTECKRLKAQRPKL